MEGDGKRALEESRSRKEVEEGSKVGEGEEDGRKGDGKRGSGNQLKMGGENQRVGKEADERGGNMRSSRAVRS